MQRCPVCRSRVTVLFGGLAGAPARLQRAVHRYNVRFSGVPRSAWEHLVEMPTVLYEGLRRATMGDLVRLTLLLCGVQKLFFIAVLLLYVVSPIDLIPDVMPVVGVLDDVTFALFGLCLLAKAVIEVAVAAGEQRMAAGAAGGVRRRGGAPPVDAADAGGGGRVDIAAGFADDNDGEWVVLDNNNPAGDAVGPDIPNVD
mmetsp:Transcript_28804/g.75581  ORF Transcript_28804/g.75581 Transcript_28804/m.75581 type:complete len:199 (-) Transcript_28804:465-1061(-)